MGRKHKIFVTDNSFESVHQCNMKSNLVDQVSAVHIN